MRRRRLNATPTHKDANHNASATCSWIAVVYKRPESRDTFKNNLKVQDALSILLILEILPFAKLIAFCCVLHRYSSQGIHR